MVLPQEQVILTLRIFQPLKDGNFKERALDALSKNLCSLEKPIFA
jgi:hypothetical protein